MFRRLITRLRTAKSTAVEAARREAAIAVHAAQTRGDTRDIHVAVEAMKRLTTEALKLETAR